MSSLYFDILKDRLYVLSPNRIERKSAQTVLFYLASFLTRFVAPIMPFTAEEIWKAFSLKDKKESIFLEEYPCTSAIEKELLKVWSKDKNIFEKWEKIFDFRRVLLKKIEEKRLEKIIGNSLEAKVVIGLEKEILDISLAEGINNELFWSQIAIVSQVEIKVCNALDDKVLIEKDLLPENLKGTKIFVSVAKADGYKCSRCWNWSKKVTKMSDEHELCDRCLEILNKW